MGTRALLAQFQVRRCRSRLALGLALGTAFLVAGSADAEVGVTEKEILLGESAVFSGPAAALGTDLHAGEQVYFDHINEQGGIYGRRIRLVTKDDGYEPGRAKDNTAELIQKTHVFALIGYVGTPTSNAALPLITEAKVPFFGPYTGAQSLREPFNRYVFNVRASYFDEIERIVDQVVRVGTSRVAIFYQNDAYGKTGLEGLRRAMDKRKMQIAAETTVERNSVDVADAAKKLVAASPDVIVQVSAYSSCAALIKEMRRLGYTGQFANVSFVGSKPLADALGDEGAGVMITQVVPFPFSETLPIEREYMQAMQRAGVKEVGFGSMEGYLVAKAFVEGLRRAGHDLTRDRLIEALESMHDVDLGGFTVSFSPTNHNGSNYSEITLIGQRGQFVH